MSFISAIFKGNSTTIREDSIIPIQDNLEYQAILYPIRSEVSIQTDDFPATVYVVISNGVPINAFREEIKAQEAVQNLTLSLMCKNTYKMHNGRAVFIYSIDNNNLIYKIWYTSIVVE